MAPPIAQGVLSLGTLLPTPSGVPATPSPLPGVPFLQDRSAPSQRLTRIPDLAVHRLARQGTAPRLPCSFVACAAWTCPLPRRVRRDFARILSGVGFRPLPPF